MMYLHELLIQLFWIQDILQMGAISNIEASFRQNIKRSTRVLDGYRKYFVAHDAENIDG